MTEYDTFVYRVGEDKDDRLLYVCLPCWRGEKRLIIILLFTVLERIKISDYNTFVYRVGADKDVCL